METEEKSANAGDTVEHASGEKRYRVELEMALEYSALVQATDVETAKERVMDALDHKKHWPTHFELRVKNAELDEEYDSDDDEQAVREGSLREPSFFDFAQFQFDEYNAGIYDSHQENALEGCFALNERGREFTQAHAETMAKRSVARNRLADRMLAFMKEAGREVTVDEVLADLLTTERDALIATLPVLPVTAAVNGETPAVAVRIGNFNEKIVVDGVPAHLFATEGGAR